MINTIVILLVITVLAIVAYLVYERVLESKIESMEQQMWLKNRLREYPSIEECMHAILDNELDTLQTKRAAIKAKYPKN